MKVLIWINRLLIDWACVCSTGTSMIAAQTIAATPMSHNAFPLKAPHRETDSSSWRKRLHAFISVRMALLTATTAAAQSQPRLEIGNRQGNYYWVVETRPTARARAVGSA